MKWTPLWERLKSNSISRALLLSLLIHLAAFLTIETGNKVGLWKMRAIPKWALKTPPVDPNKQPEREQQIVLQFIEVDPSQTVEEPKEAKYYSSANSQAANPDPRLDLERPKIDGNQDKVPKLTDTAKAEPAPPSPPKKDTMQPAPAPRQQAAAPAEPPGDTKENTLTPEEKAKKDVTFDRPQDKPPTRPRTLADARQQKGITEGPKMKQEGGVKRFSLEMSADAKKTPFGSYDAAFIAAVQSRWFQILDQRSYVADQSGKVVVEFRLYKDGTIKDLKVSEAQVTDTLSWACQRAILDPAPYAPFPPDLRRLLGAEFREVRFTFYYN